MVLADDSADPRLVAADLLSQAEHDPCAQVLLVTLSRALADGVEAALRASVSRLPRHAIAATALSFARILIVESLDEGIDIRSEERRVGKEWVSTGRSRWAPYP